MGYSSVSFDTLIASQGSDVTWNSSPNPTRITFNVTGTYEVYYAFCSPVGQDGTGVQSQLIKNGSTVIYNLDVSASNYAANVVGTQFQYPSFIYTFTAGDYIELQGRAQDGTSTDFMAMRQLVVKRLTVGPAGASGYSGLSGFSGFNGQGGGLSLNYVFDAATSSTPAAGHLGFNSATIGSISNIYLNKFDANGVDVSSIINAMPSGGNVKIQDDSDPSKYVVIDWFGAPSLTGNVYTVGCFVLSGNALPADQDNITMNYGVAGNPGANGNPAGPEWQFDDSNTTTPAAGFFSFDNNALASTTTMYFNVTDTHSNDQTLYLGAIAASNLLSIIFPNTQSNNFGEWTVALNNGLVGSVVSLTIGAFLSGLGPFSLDDFMAVYFVPSGIDGASGYSGHSGYSGAAGTIIGAYKASPEGRTNTAVQAIDGDLQVPLVAGHQYAVRLTLLFNAPNSTEAIFSLNTPDGLTLSACNFWGTNFNGIATTGGGGIDFFLLGQGSLGASFAAFGSGNFTSASWLEITIEGGITVTGDGTLALYWSQAASGAATVTLNAGSTMIVTQIS